MNDRITVLLRDNKGSAIGTGELPAAALDRGPVYVSIPQWPGSSEYFVIELRREGEPVQVDGAAADWDAPLPEPVDQGPTVPQLPVIPDQPERPEHPELAAALAAEGPGTVTFNVNCPDGTSIILRDQAGARTIGEIGTEMAERLGLAEHGTSNAWTLAAPGRAAYPVALRLTPAADGMTFALVQAPAPAHTGG